MVMKKLNRSLGLLLRLWPLVLVGSVVLTYALIMVLSLGQSIWFDEGYSLQLIERPVGELLSLTAVDAHPPLYYLVLKVWASIFGTSEWAFRSLSAVSAALTVGVVFFLVKKLFTVRTAIAVLPFLILAPFFLRYGYEIRMYVFAGLIGALATLVLVYARTSKSPLKYWIFYAILVALGMYTLYTSVAIWIAHFVWLLVEDVRAKKNIFKQPWVVSFVGAVVLFAPYIATFLWQLTNSALPGIGSSITLTRFADITSMLLLYLPEWELTGWLSLIIAVYLVLVVVVAAKVFKRLSPNSWQLRLLLVMATVPLGFFVLWALSPEPSFINRYLSHVSIYIYLFIAVVSILFLQQTHSYRSYLFILAGIGIFAFGTLQLQETGNLNFERMQQAKTTEIRQTVNCNNATVVAEDPYTYIDVAYYFKDCDLRFYSENPVQKKGGYAPLYDSQARIDTSADLGSRTLYHLHWGNKTDSSFVTDTRYQQVSTETFDKQILDTYVLSAE